MLLPLKVEGPNFFLYLKQLRAKLFEHVIRSSLGYFIGFSKGYVNVIDRILLGE